MKPQKTMIGGREISLAFPMLSFRELEDEVGSLDDAVDKLGELDVMTIYQATAIMAKGASVIEGKQPYIDIVDIAKMLTLDQVLVMPQVLNNVISDWLRMETETGSSITDLVLQELDREEGRHALTYRKLTGMGLIAGLTLSEMDLMPPGMVCDLFLERRAYDDQQHRIKRKGGD